MVIFKSILSFRAWAHNSNNRSLQQICVSGSSTLNDVSTPVKASAVHFLWQSGPQCQANSWTIRKFSCALCLPTDDDCPIWHSPNVFAAHGPVDSLKIFSAPEVTSLWKLDVGSGSSLFKSAWFSFETFDFSCISICGNSSSYKLPRHISWLNSFNSKCKLQLVNPFGFKHCGSIAVIEFERLLFLENRSMVVSA